MRAKLTQGGVGSGGAQMYSVVRYPGGSERWPKTGFEITDDDGMASVSFYVLDEINGTTVYVDVYLVHEDKSYQAATVFVIET